MSHMAFSPNSFSSDMTSCLSSYMEHKNNYNCKNDEKSIYDELEEKDRDLMIAAQLGQALLNANENLKRKNEMLVEEFQQKIYEMENEKTALRKRLEAVENDYEMQMQALQRDIMTLRKEINSQKTGFMLQINEHDNDLSDVMKENEMLIKTLQVSRTENFSLNQKLSDLEEKINTERLSMHEHLQQLELLKTEILKLREDKRQLETRIREIIQERDSLLSQLDEAKQQTEHLEKINKQNRETIELQQQEILNLQQTAEFLQDSLSNLQKRNDIEKDVNLNDVYNENNEKRPADLWWKVWLENDGDNVEMDEDSVITSMAVSGTSPWNTTVVTQNELDVEEEQPQFIKDLKTEVLEVYAQLRAICADLSFRHTADSSKPASTPDELALVEMDFKLGSLRSTLNELRGLLTDLAVSQRRTEAHEDIMKVQIREAQMELEQKSKYLTQLQEELRIHENKLQRLLTSEYESSEEFLETREKLMSKKLDIERKMTRTQSEMEVLTGSMIQQDGVQKWPHFEDEDCEYD